MDPIQSIMMFLSWTKQRSRFNGLMIGLSHPLTCLDVCRHIPLQRRPKKILFIGFMDLPRDQSGRATSSTLRNCFHLAYIINASYIYILNNSRSFILSIISPLFGLNDAGTSCCVQAEDTSGPVSLLV